MLRFYDFFAGAGLATLGLRHAWECVWANDIDLNKARVYKANFGPDHFHAGDVATYSAADLPNSTHMAWASFPCQDLSLAGWGKGLSAERSGAFWAFWKIMRGQHQRGARPPVIVIENVAGLLYGDSFAGLCEALAALGMQFGALVIDARRFVPQSRPRVFVVAVDAQVDCSSVSGPEPVIEWTPPALVNAQAALDKQLQKLWRWWQLPVANVIRVPLTEIIEVSPTAVDWHSTQETQRLLGMMTETNRAKIAERQRDGKRHIGFLYKRIREGVQRAEVRFDIAGCLRTPRGGSSRQTVVVIDRGKLRSRLLCPREAARLMGAPDTFKLPEKYNDAYGAMGDAVVVPVVRWLSENLLEPLAALAQGKGQGKTSAHTDRMIRSAEKRASEWTLELKRMANMELTDKCIAVLAAWHKQRDAHKGTASDSFIACAGIKVAELSKRKWPIVRDDSVSKGGRFRSTGPFIQGVLARFGEERPYTSEGGRTTGGSIEAAEDLAARLNAIKGYAESSSEEKTAVAEAIQRWLYDTIIKPSLDTEGVKVEVNLEKLAPDIIGDILEAATRQGVSGAVAQHLVGAKLALRYPNMAIENHHHTKKDDSLGRKGDLEVNDTIFHVTMAPGEAVVAKCADCVREGYQTMLLVPRSEMDGARHFIKKSKAPKRIWLTSIEEFVAQNIAEIGEFGKDGLRNGLKALLTKYNERAAQVETLRAVLLKIPDNL